MRSLTTTDTCQGFWVTYDHKVRSLTTTEPHIHWQGQQNLHSAWGHLWPQNAVTYDHKTLSQQNNRRGWGGWGWGGWDDNVPWLAHRNAERWSGLPALGLHTCWPILVGGGGVGGMITYLGLHTDTPKGGLVYRLWACTHAGPFWWVAVGRVGWSYKVLLCATKYYSVLQSTTTKYYSSTTFYYKVPLQYYSVLLQYYSSPNIVLRLSTQISANAAPANKSDTPTSPNNALATRSETPTWPNIAPATKSDTVTVPAVTSDQNLRSQATKTCGHKRPPALDLIYIYIFGNHWAVPISMSLRFMATARPGVWIGVVGPVTWNRSTQWKWKEDEKWNEIGWGNFGWIQFCRNFWEDKCSWQLAKVHKLSICSIHNYRDPKHHH